MIIRNIYISKLLNAYKDILKEIFFIIYFFLQLIYNKNLFLIKRYTVFIFNEFKSIEYYISRNKSYLKYICSFI